mgnify:CR=1 FL=1
MAKTNKKGVILSPFQEVAITLSRDYDPQDFFTPSQKKTLGSFQRGETIDDARSVSKKTTFRIKYADIKEGENVWSPESIENVLPQNYFFPDETTLCAIIMELVTCQRTGRKGLLLKSHEPILVDNLFFLAKRKEMAVRIATGMAEKPTSTEAVVVRWGPFISEVPGWYPYSWGKDTGNWNHIRRVFLPGK